MSKDDVQVRVQHFAALKSKYQATNYEYLSPSSLLYLILRKADLGVEINEIELNWLREHGLLESIAAIKNESEHRAKETKKLEAEFSNLKNKYRAESIDTFSNTGSLYPILWKLDSESKLNDTEIAWLKDNKYDQTAKLAEDINNFALLKAKYRAAKHPHSLPKSYLYQILKNLEAEKQLIDVDINWLKEQQLFETLAIFEEQEALKKAEFAKIKEKYQATTHPDLSVSSPLYQILKNLDADKQLSLSDINWLEDNLLSETLGIVVEIEQKRHFAELKGKYQANEYQDLSPSSHLYKVLKKIDLDSPLGEQDINFLRKRKLTETITVALDKYVARMKSKVESGEQ